MERINNWEQIQEKGEMKYLQPGVYVCKILRVEDVKDKQYLKVEFDIYEGENKGYFAERFERYKRWSGTYYASYKDQSQSSFKRFITAVENSNTGFKWNWIETQLVGKVVVFAFGRVEEIVENPKTKVKSLKWLVKPRYPHSIKSLRDGKVEIPEDRHIDPTKVDITDVEPKGKLQQDPNWTPPTRNSSEPTKPSVNVEIDVDDLPF